VEKYPEKKGYFELKNDVMKFEFPKPGPLAGVKSMSKALVKLSKVGFQYPTRDTPTIFDVDLQASRVSRVAVIGANGAGKSTAIKVLLGELKASSGEVYRHQDLRLAYVAQSLALWVRSCSVFPFVAPLPRGLFARSSPVARFPGP